MPDFSRPEYKSYTALCVDWFERDGGTDGTEADRWLRAHGRVLPSLSDWLEILEVAGYRAVAICRKTGLGRPDECWAETHRMLSWGEFGDEVHVDAPTREEAVARLWMKVITTRTD